MLLYNTMLIDQYAEDMHARGSDCQDLTLKALPAKYASCTVYTQACPDDLDYRFLKAMKLQYVKTNNKNSPLSKI